MTLRSILLALGAAIPTALPAQARDLTGETVGKLHAGDLVRYHRPDGAVCVEPILGIDPPVLQFAVRNGAFDCGAHEVNLTDLVRLDVRRGSNLGPSVARGFLFGAAVGLALAVMRPGESSTGKAAAAYGLSLGTVGALVGVAHGAGRPRWRVVDLAGSRTGPDW